MDFHKYRFTSNVQMVADVLRMTTLNPHIPINSHPIIESPKGTGGGPVRRFAPDTAHPVQFTQYLNKALRAARSSPTQRHTAYVATFNTGVSPIVSYQRIHSHEIPASFHPDNVIYNPITGEIRFINRGLTDREKRTIAQIRRARIEAGDAGTQFPDRDYYQSLIENGICNVDASGSRLSATLPGLGGGGGGGCSGIDKGSSDVMGYFNTHPLFRGVPSKYTLPTRNDRSDGVNDFGTWSRIKPPAGVVIGLDSSLSPINMVARQVASGNTVTRYVSNGVYTRSCDPGSNDPACLNTMQATAGSSGGGHNVMDAVHAIVRACIKQSERIGGGSVTATALGVGKSGTGETERAIQDIIRASSAPSALIGQTMQYLRSLPNNPVNTRAARYFMAILVSIGYIDPNDSTVRRILAADADMSLVAQQQPRRGGRW